MWTLPPLQKAAVMLAGSGCRRLFVMVLLAAGSATGNVESITGGGHEERPAWWPYDPVVYPKMTTYQKRNLYAISLMERVAPVEQRIEGNVSYIVFDEASGAGGELEPLWRTRVMTDRWTEQGGYLFDPPAEQAGGDGAHPGRLDACRRWPASGCCGARSPRGTGIQVGPPVYPPGADNRQRPRTPGGAGQRPVCIRSGRRAQQDVRAESRPGRF